MSSISTFYQSVEKWWSPSDLIQTTPGLEWHFRWIYMSLVALCFIGGVLSIFLKIRPSLKARLQSFFWWNTFLGVLLYFFRDQRVPYLGMDLLRLIQEIGIVFWINSIVLFSRTGLKKELIADQVKARKEKYLPKNVA